MKILFALILLIICFFIFRFFFLGKKSQTMKPTVGLINGALHDCGKKPNCFSSFANDKEKHIEALPILTSKNDFINKLKKIIGDQKGAKLISETPDYMHIEFQSQLFGFVDDVEFYFPQDKLFMRSASRVGTSDFGQNRKRLNLIIKLLN